MHVLMLLIFFFQISLEIPDDFATYSSEITLYLQNYSDAIIYLIGDRVYENCCNDRLSAQHIQADAAVHFGHACLSCDSELPTYYIFTKQNLLLNEFCEEFCKYFEDKTKRILFFYDTSFAYSIGKK